MLVLGAKGHAKEILKIALDNGIPANSLLFFDDITQGGEDKLFNTFPIIQNMEEAEAALATDNRCILGLGNPVYRRVLYEKFKNKGALFINMISKNTYLSPAAIAVEMGEGLNIMDGVFISNDIRIGTGCLLNFGCSIHHDVTIGEFCELAPRSQILGGARIGNDCFIGAGAIILPQIILGNGVTVGAGAVVTRNVAENNVVAGIPAKRIE